MKAKKNILAAILISTFLIQNIAFADVPPSSAVASEHKRFAEEKLRDAEKKALKETKTAIKTEAPKVSSSAASGPRFRMNDVRITGNESIPTEELRPMVSKLLNRDVNIQEIQDVVTEIKNYYRERGFIATYVSVPPQKIQQGVVELRVVEGKLGNIEVVGNRWYKTELLRDRIQVEPGVIIQYDDLRKSLSKLNKNRDIEAKAVLKPGVQPETTDIQINVKDEFPMDISADVNNLGTRNTGKTRWGISAAHNNLLGRMDVLSGRFEIGKSAWGAGGDYYMPLNSHDTRLGFSYQHSSVKLGGPFRDLNIRGKADTYNPYLSHPVFESDHVTATMRTGFEFKEIQNTVLGQTAGRDRLRILNLGLNLEQQDSLGKTFSPHEFNFGFANFLGSSGLVDEQATRTGTGGQFFVYRGAISRYTRLPADMTLALRSGLQLTPDRLTPSEQYRLGGAFTVRGYPEGDYLADYGGNISAEIFVPTYFFPEDWKLPFSKLPLRKQIQGTAFFDFGAGANHNASPGEANEGTLAGFGGGLRIHLFDRVYARTEWARPVAKKASDNQDSAFYFGVSVEFM